MLLLLTSCYPFNFFGHSFEYNGSITFLTLFEKAKIALYFLNKNYPANITLSMDHANNAVRLVDESFYVDENIAINFEFTETYDK